MVSRKTLLSVCFFLSWFAFLQAQQEKNEWVTVLPITDYIVRDDGMLIVQVHIPENVSIQIKERALGLMKKNYENDKTLAVNDGYAMRCLLIKGQYFYFACKDSALQFSPQEGDLLYMMLPKPQYADLPLVKLAAYHIGFKCLGEEEGEKEIITAPLTVLSHWSKAKEEEAITQMTKDIQAVGKYYIQSGEMDNMLITKGKYSNKKIFDVMLACTNKEVNQFLAYVNSNKLAYTGNTWVISEVFATWLSRGAPSE